MLCLLYTHWLVCFIFLKILLSWPDHNPLGDITEYTLKYLTNTFKEIVIEVDKEEKAYSDEIKLN